MTTGVDRRTLRIMGELPTPETRSLDDGIPYYPSLTAMAESPVKEGVLYVGTDDGNFQVSLDGGVSWTQTSGNVPGLPADAWINGIEASPTEAGRVYLAANNYRNDDYANYLFVSEDSGGTWADITGNLPPERVIRTVREDPKNPHVLYLGTEFGLFFSPDRGRNWIQLDLGLPMTAVNDLVIHPRDNDLIIGTHGRGIWILDDLSPLQELPPPSRIVENGTPSTEPPPSPQTFTPGYIFSIEPAEQIRYRSEKGHTGDMIFRGANPAAGARIFYWLAAGMEDVGIDVTSETGEPVATLRATEERGINRTSWNLRYAEPGQEEGQPPRGPLVNPGTYLVRLSLRSPEDSSDATVHAEMSVEVREDPRLQVEPAVRQQWTQDLLVLGSLSRQATAGAADMRDLARSIEASAAAPESMREEARELNRQWGELGSRIRRLIGEVEGWVGPPTQQQESQWAYYQEMLGTLGQEARDLARRFGPAYPKGGSP
jgi:hypothetical protein